MLTSLLLNPAMSILSGNFKVNLLLVLCVFYSCFVFTNTFFPLSFLSFTSLKSNPNRRFTHKAMVGMSQRAFVYLVLRACAFRASTRVHFFFVWRGSIIQFVLSLMF